MATFGGIEIVESPYLQKGEWLAHDQKGRMLKTGQWAAEKPIGDQMVPTGTFRLTVATDVWDKVKKAVQTGR